MVGSSASTRLRQAAGLTSSVPSFSPNLRISTVMRQRRQAQGQQSQSYAVTYAVQLIQLSSMAHRLVWNRAAQIKEHK